MPKGYVFSKTDQTIRQLWQTPKYIFDWFNKRFAFTHDVAASDTNHLAPLYFTQEQNSLIQDWGSSNWCNPPFDNIQAFIDKAIEESKKGKTTVMLLPSDTSVTWFYNGFNAASKVIFLKGRLAYHRADTGQKVSNNNKGSVFFIFSPKRFTGDRVVMLERDSMKES